MLMPTGEYLSAMHSLPSIHRRLSTLPIPHGDLIMAKYLVQVNYVGEGVKGLLKDGGSKRRAVVEQLFKSMGGTNRSLLTGF